MKLYGFITCALLPLMFAACSGSRNDSSATEVEQSTETAVDQQQPTVNHMQLAVLEAPAGMVKKYVDSNEIIDVDINDLSQRLIKQASGASDATDISVEEIAKAKAVIYRFYKHVSVRDSLYYCDLTNGAEINISDQVFNALKNNIDEMNSQMQEMKKQGKSYHLSAPSERYFNSLLE